MHEQGADTEPSASKAADKRRPIRSFVVRSGRMTLGQRKGWDDYWETMGLEPSKQLLDFDQIFERSNPVVFEIGFGMGASLFEMAQQHPDMNFIGVEVHRPGVGALLALAGDAGLRNLKVFCCDANDVLDHMIKDGSLERVQIYFPDPWHKKRHHKRRLVKEEFIEKLGKKLRTEGILHLATDWEPYAEQMLELLDASEIFVNCAGSGNYSPKPDYRPKTKFERRGLKLGHGVWDLLYTNLQN